MFYKMFVFMLVLPISVNSSQGCGDPWDPRCNRSYPVNGLYGGISLGYTNLVGQLSRTLNVNASDRTTSVGESGSAPGAFVGYQIFDGKIYLAAEGFYQHSDIVIEKEENTFPGFINYFTYIKNDHKSGIVGKFGFVHSGHIFYIKTGLELSRFILGFRDKNESPAITSSKSRIRKGIILGGGMDYFINRNFAIVMEYGITNYSSMNFKNNSVGSFCFKPASHVFQVRLKYTF